MAASSTAVPASPKPLHTTTTINESTELDNLDRRINTAHHGDEEQAPPLAPDDDAPTPTNTVTAVQPLALTTARKLKLASALLCFFNAGINEGSLGALIPSILSTYHMSTRAMAVPYVLIFCGWFLAAVIGSYCRLLLGGGGVIIAGATLQLLAQLLRFWVPPWGLFCTTFFLVALGQALQEPQANTFVAGLKDAHRWLGLIHGGFAVGGFAGPLMAAAVAANVQGSRWAVFYAIPAGIGAVNLGLCVYAFFDEIAFVERRRRRLRGEAVVVRQRDSTAALVELRATLKQRPVWLLSLFFFLYLGAAVTAGGYVVEFLLVVRHGRYSRVGYMSAALYGGLAAGRFLLAEPTHRYGEKRMFLVYAILSLGLQILFWQVKSVSVDAVMICFLGFFLGPAFATGVSVGTQLVPVELRPAGLSFIFVSGQAGGALFPAITGVIAADVGVASLQPLVVGLLAALVVSWYIVPDPRKLERS